MSYMTGAFSVTADGAVVGRVTVAQNGLLLVFDCTCDCKARDILRLAAVCNGKYVPLGVMVPEAGLLRTKKSFTKNALLSVGYEDTVLFHLIKPGAVYSEPEADEQVLPVDAEAAANVIPAVSAVEDSVPEQDTQPVEYIDFPDPENYDFDYGDDDSEPEDGGKAAVSEPAEAGREPEFDTYRHAPEPEARAVETLPSPPHPSAAPADLSAAPADLSAAPADLSSETVDGWMPLPNPGILFDDQSIQEACAGISDALMTEEDGCILLAVPVLPTAPFPLMPVFCFGSSGQVGGQEYIIFKIKNGNLSL